MFHSPVKLLIDDRLSAFAVKHLPKAGISVGSDETAAFTLAIEPLKQQPRLAGAYKVDNSIYVGEDYIFEKCKYKFSSWEYCLSGLSDPHQWRLAVRGDFFSSWVWPFRTVQPLLRLLLGRHGYFFFHAAAYYADGKATMMLAPSGTGKTLTTLHWLCDGGRIYDDDTVIWHDGDLHCGIESIRFWYDRYRGSPGVLPETMPALSARDRRRTRLCRLLKIASLGMVGLGPTLDIEEYWPEAFAPPAPVGKVLALGKGEQLTVSSQCDSEVLINRLMGDLHFQNLPLLRLAETATLIGLDPLGCRQWFQDNRAILQGILQDARVSHITVPPLYSREVFETIKRHMT